MMRTCLWRQARAIRQGLMKGIPLFFITTLFASGCWYLLFQFDEDMNSINQGIVKLDNAARQVEACNTMLATFISGWFANQSNLALQRKIMDGLINASVNQLPDLSGSLPKNSLDWIGTSILQLTSERGKVDGISLTREIDKRMQKSIEELYDSKRSELIGIRELILKWRVLSLSERDQLVQSIELSTHGSIQALHAILTTLPQMKSEADAELRYYGQLRKELTVRLDKMAWKRLGSVAVIVMAIAIILFSLRGSRIQRRAKKGRSARLPRSDHYNDPEVLVGLSF